MTIKEQRSAIGAALASRTPLTAFRTMTVGGICGNTYEAADAECAAVMAEADRYEVLDIQDDILVIADGA